MSVWGSNDGLAWMYLGGVGHVELIEGFFWLTWPFTFSLTHEILF